MKPRIGVLMGGRSAEKEVSMRTGEAIYNALLEKGFDAVRILVDFDIVEKLRREKVELAFIALHGKYGEDGTIQGFLEMLDIPYTGSGVLASALCMDKIATKKMLLHEQLPTPGFSVVDIADFRARQDEILETTAARLGVPVVVKAPTQGSTIGTSFVHDREDLLPAFQEAFKYDNFALVEEMVEGTEITASILGNRDPVALPLIEIFSHTGVYDYESKYTAGLSDHIIPPRVTGELQEEIKELAVKAFKGLGCRGVSRVDFLVDKNNRPTILEINTIPGMTETSLVPDAARAEGISFAELVEKMVNLALE